MFEFFPPKSDEAFDALVDMIRELQRLRPTLVSVTYGAGGGTCRRAVDVAAKAKGELGQESMAHLTCVGSTAHKLRNILDELKAQGIENVLLLRGDPQAGTDVFGKTPGGFGSANDLVAFIKESYVVSLGVACYSEGHQEADDFDTDLPNLKLKVDAGADFVITQMFFDNRFYFDFVEQIKRFTRMCGASVPETLLERLEPIKEDADALWQCGVERASQQCRELLEGGTPGIHFYTLSCSTSTRDIFENLKAVGALA